MSTATPPRPVGTDHGERRPQRQLTPITLAVVVFAFGLVAIFFMKALVFLVDVAMSQPSVAAALRRLASAFGSP